MNEAAPVAAAIIAGGAATRLGGLPKSTLVVDGRTIAERLLEALRATFPRVLVVANDAAPWAGLGVEVTPDVDVHRGAGPLAGIHAALTATAEHAGVVCVAGDMPFVEPRLLELLRDHAPGAEAVVPRFSRRFVQPFVQPFAQPFVQPFAQPFVGRPEPLLARWSGACLPVIEARLAAGARAAHGVFDVVRTVWLDEPALRAVDPGLSSFTNVNTPEDLRRARDFAGS